MKQGAMAQSHRFNEGKLSVITTSDVVRALREVGIGQGDMVGAHASVKELCPGLRRPDDVRAAGRALIDGLKEAVGGEGLVMMPTFSFCFAGNPRKCVYHPDKTPSRTGFVTDMMRQDTDTIRTLHPTHSVTIWGHRAAEFAADHETKPGLGLDTPFHRLAVAGGKIVFLGTDFHTCSLIHVAETVAKAPYLDTFRWAYLGWEAAALVEGPNGEEMKVPLVEVPGCSNHFEACRGPMEAKGLLSETPLGQGKVTGFSASALIDTVCEELAKDATFLLCPKGTCEACEAARKAVGCRL